MHVSSSTPLEHLNVSGRGLSIHKNMLSEGRTQVIAQVGELGGGGGEEGGGEEEGV